MSNEVDRYNMMELSLIDTISSFKNELNYIALMVKSMRKTNISEVTEKIVKKIDGVSDKLNDKVGFYSKRIIYEKTNIIEELEYFCKIFEPVAEQFKMQIYSNIDKEVDLTLKAYKLKNIFYNSFEFLISLNTKLDTQSTIDVEISNSLAKEGYEISFVIKNTTFDKQEIENEFHEFKLLIEKDDLTASLNISKEINVKILIRSSKE